MKPATGIAAARRRTANWLPHPGCSNVGGANRDRTDDLKLAKLALSQLSYGPKGYESSRFAPSLS